MVRFATAVEGPGGVSRVTQAHLQILDRRGTGHGLSAWFRGLLQNWTYHEQILGLFSEGLISGDFLTVVPCVPGGRREIAAAAISHEGHSLYYCFLSAFEQNCAIGAS